MLGAVLVHRGILWSRRGPCFLGARSYPSAITHSAFLDQPRRRRPRPNENCPLRMRWASSMPAIVIAAFANDLNPVIDAPHHPTASNYGRAVVERADGPGRLAGSSLAA